MSGLTAYLQDYRVWDSAGRSEVVGNIHLIRSWNGRVINSKILTIEPEIVTSTRTNDLQWIFTLSVRILTGLSTGSRAVEVPQALVSPCTLERQFIKQRSNTMSRNCLTVPAHVAPISDHSADPGTSLPSFESFGARSASGPASLNTARLAATGKMSHNKDLQLHMRQKASVWQTL